MKRYEIILELLLECLILAAQIFFFIYIIPKILGFLWPFVIGWVIALIAAPLTAALQNKLKFSRHSISICILVVFIAVIGGSIYFILAALGKEALHFMADVPMMYDQFLESTKHITEFVRSLKFLPDTVQFNMDQIMISVKEVLLATVNEIGSAGVNHMGTIASNVINFLIGVIVSILSAYFFIVYKERIYQFYRNRFSTDFQKRMDHIFFHIKNALGGYVVAQLKIMGIIFAILSAGLLIGRNPYALFVAMLIALVDIIPFLGTGFVLVPWALFDFIAGNYFLMILRMVLYVICLLSRQLLQPKIIGDSVGLNPFVTLLLIYVGFKVGGILGFLLAMIIGIISLNFYKLGLFDQKIARFKHLLKQLKEANQSRF